MANTYYCWMGWTNYENGNDYATAESLSIMGDRGQAYGSYQFDYRYGLVPFMQYCLDSDADYFIKFKKFVNMGAGSSSLVNNTELHNIFIQFASDTTTYNNRDRNAIFLTLQDTKGIEAYLDVIVSAVKSRYGYNLVDKGAYVLGYAFSHAIRNGGESGLSAFAGGASMSPQALIKQITDWNANAHSTYETPRWSSSSAYPSSQYWKCINAMSASSQCYTVPYTGAHIGGEPEPPGPEPPGPEPPTPQPTTTKKMPIWFYLRRRIL